MKIIIDKAIPFIQGVFEPYGTIVYKDGGDIVAEDLKDVDAMVIRTRTNCNAELLEGSNVKIISTATIGTGHIDLKFCEDHGIFVKNASGCNAGGVMNYVISALYGAAARKSIPLTGATMGIVGLGNVGSRVETIARLLGFKILKYDPPRAEAEGAAMFCSLDELLEGSDIVTMHLPLNDRTKGIADASFFKKMRPGAIFINSSHGGLVVEEDLIAAIPKLGAVIIDAWDNEPDINRELMRMVDIATPHIAGYSYQGKLLGTALAVRAVARFFSIPELYDFYPESEVKELNAVKLDLRGKDQGQTASIIQYNYPVFTDDFMFRMDPGNFEGIRMNYRYRREFFID